MADLVVPPLGESITEGVISKWLKQPGDSVETDEPVLDLETDKITVQIPAPEAGALVDQRVGEGDTVQVGDVVGTIGEAAAAEAAPSAGGAREAEREPAPSADGRAEARPDGKFAGDGARTDGARGEAEGVQPAPEPRPEPEEEARPEAGGAAPAGGRRLTPAQRRARREGALAKGEPEAPAGGPGRAAPTEAKQAPAEAKQAPAEAKQAPAEADEKPENVVRMSPLRKRIAQRLVEAQQSTASLSTFNEVDMSAVMALRKRYQDLFVAEYDTKLGFMSFFVKAAVEALKRYPGVNAEVRDESIVYKKYYDLGIAVNTERGLIVPVLREADRLGFADIETGIIELANKARDNKLVLDDLMGATFSITNGGIFGSMLSTPLLNFPQTGILGMHNIVDRPVAVDGKVEIRPMMYIALTYDHRVVDGREAVQFLVAIKERIEQPERLMFEV